MKGHKMPGELAKLQTGGEGVPDPVRLEGVGRATGVTALDETVSIVNTSEAPKPRHFRDHTNPFTMTLPDRWFPQGVLHPKKHSRH